MTVELTVLGPVEIRAAGRVADAGHARQRAVLAVLLLELGRAVPAATLIDRVWGEDPPASVRNVLYGYVGRLRTVINAAGDPGVKLVRCSGGYELQARTDQLDLHRFRGLVAAAAASADQPQEALLREALGLWRGRALAGLDSPWLERAAATLEMERVAAVLDPNDIRLRQGNHASLVSELTGLAGAAPGDERLIGQLMLALYRSDRQAEALRWFAQTRQYLASELGVDPGPSLQALYQQILHADPSLAIGALPSGSQRPVPRQLPAEVRHFAGRAAELDALLRLPDRVDDAQVPAAVVWAIDGMAGVGKTALAVQAAHRLAAEFPDGQLFIDLHGYTQDREPRPAGEALAAFLRALGVPPQHVPQDLDEGAALYRSELAGRRMLIVLDNASAESQVLPLLPGAAGCLVLITSRRRLKSLDQAHVLSLDVLPQDDAIGLLRAVAGHTRLAAGDPVLPELCGLCGQLPLALSIAGALLRHRRAWIPQYLAGLLRDHRRVSSFADGERDLGAVFDLSYRALGDAQQYLFRCLGLVPGPDVDAYAAATLTGGELADTTRLLEDLVDQNLLTEYAPGRYRLHDLLRLQAAALASRDPAVGRADAFTRLLDYYQHTAARADAVVSVYSRHAPDRPGPTSGPALSGPDGAWLWLRTERPNLLAALAHPSARGHVVSLTAYLASLLRTDGPWSEAVDLHAAAVATAQRTSDQAGQASARFHLGDARGLAGDYPGAVADLQQAADLYRQARDQRGQANALIRLGNIRCLTGDYPAAIRDLRDALQAHRSLKDRRGQANALTRLGIVRTLTGDYLAAIREQQQALDLYRALDEWRGQANALTSLGDARRLTGDLSGATRDLHEALDLFRELGEQRGQASALTWLANTRLAAGDLSGATRDLDEALDLFRKRDDHLGEAAALTLLGETRRSVGDHVAAISDLQEALGLFRRIGALGNQAWALNYYAAAIADTGNTTEALALRQEALHLARQTRQPDDEALALEGIGECHLHAGDITVGIHHLEQARDIFRRLAMQPDTRRVQTRLTQIASAGTQDRSR